MDANAQRRGPLLNTQTFPPPEKTGRPAFRLHWGNAVFLLTVHLLAIVAAAGLACGWFPWQTAALGGAFFLLCGLSITGGYHRLFAHAAYRGRAALRLFYLFFGAASVQNSALQWVSDHRRHHRRTDSDDDPYNIKRGFWWAHIGWVLFKDVEQDTGPRDVSDLERDPLVRFQHRHYYTLALGAGFLLPVATASLWGDALGGALVACFLRLALQYHATFAINSVAHTFGDQPFGGTVSARNHALTAILTLGEGYHNFHHRFPSDYRNGYAPHHYDPTKWWIWIMARLGFASDLRRTPPTAIRSHADGWRPDTPLPC